MYAIRVAAYTTQGLGRLSELITVRTTPTDVPVQLRAHAITTHTMTLSWKVSGVRRVKHSSGVRLCK